MYEKLVVLRKTYTHSYLNKGSSIVQRLQHVFPLTCLVRLLHLSNHLVQYLNFWNVYMKVCASPYGQVLKIHVLGAIVYLLVLAWHQVECRK